ncbi:Cupredoxin [Microdochium trichocladiopsis]|uniref:Cupredoxin n=1 Tax=Microdochium trichocladiopsis TaxID=1682393 RepID=A0A9P9BTL8_9PEZI|nr:Cupredoxin [Microdochium trichocladiopsis]KAH7035627.1 Cupredoxin [Microdochium trichocladiopsis]
MSFFKVAAATIGLAASLVSATHYEVTVGKNGQLKFDPEQLTANIGDTVTYKFFAKNHAVAQSTFDHPCQLQEHGIFSGFTPNQSPDVAAPTDFTITVTDTKPLWFYCPQQNGNHCQSGMVHAINAPAQGNTLQAYKDKAVGAPPSTPAVGTLPNGGLRKLHIDVGFDGKLVFNPNNVAELTGTVVEFSYLPKNHSIVQSSFDKPCQPLDGGFSAPFFPTQETTSGVTFEVTLKDNKPVWFYCAQTAATHCQAGMVGAINAPAEGANTFDAFKGLAAHAPPSTIPPNTPLGGALKVDGVLIPHIYNNVLDLAALSADWVNVVPAVGTELDPYLAGMAGGPSPKDYEWADTITQDGVDYLQVLLFQGNFIATLLIEGFARLTVGVWANQYPEAITQTLGSLAAQSVVRLRTYTDSLQHYKRELVKPCKYNLHMDSLDQWLQTVTEALSLSIGTTQDIIGLAAKTDEWMVTPLSTGLGAQSRMAAVISMMQSHIASPSPREPLIPFQLAWPHIARKYVVDGSCTESPAFGEMLPELQIVSENRASGRLVSVKVTLPQGTQGDRWLAWLGPWGTVEYSLVGADGVATAPTGLTGWVWVVLTTKKDVAARDIETVDASGIHMLWTTEQWTSPWAA